MKLHLPLVLLGALLAAMPLIAAPVSFLAEGVDESDLIHSDRFYDTGKGYYWSFTGSQPYKGAAQLYKQYGDFSFMGDLSERMDATSYTLDAFKNLTDDANTCGYQAPANIIQYWMSYFGPFYTGSAPLPYGFTYSREYLDDLGGTQSLKLGMQMYDSWVNEGNNLKRIGSWFFRGIPYEEMMRPGAAPGGYFADYFTQSNLRYIAFSNQYAGYYPANIATFTQELIKGFGLVRKSDGALQLDRPGQIIFLHLVPETGGVGHAITCYGFETDAEGMVRSLKVVNSDDREYTLITLYVKENAEGLMSLYTDAACTSKWSYARLLWSISGLEYIQTPDSLLQLYQHYSSPETPLTWTGHASVWSADFMPTTTDELPDERTGWDVRAGDKSFHSYYAENRPALFDDSAVDTTVLVRSSLTLPSMILNNQAKDYLFIGTGSERLTAQQLLISGNAKSVFRQLHLTTNAFDCNHYTLSLGTGARLWTDSAAFSTLGQLELSGGSASFSRSLSFGKDATLRVTETSSLTAPLTMQGGSVFECVLNATHTTRALLSISGSLTLSGAVSLSISGSGLTDGALYRLCTVTSGTIDPAWMSSDYGSVSFSNKTLWLNYQSLPLYAWSGVATRWSATEFGAKAHPTDHTDIEIGRLLFEGTQAPGTVTVVGKVTPHQLTVLGGEYTLAGTGAFMECDRDILVAGDASLTIRIPFAAQGVRVQERASLTLETGQHTTLDFLSTQENTRLDFRGAVTYTINSVGVVYGQWSIGSGTTVLLCSAQNAALDAAVTAASSSSALRLENVSTSRDISYAVGSSLTSCFLGNVYVGRAENSRATAMVCEAAPVCGRYIIADGSSLQIAGSGTLSAAVSGSGTVLIGRAADVTLGVTNARPTAADTLSWNVQGTLSIGTEDNRFSDAVCRDMSVSGSVRAYQKDGTTSRYGAMHLDGGKFTLVTGGVNAGTRQIIDSLSVGANGGTLSRAYQHVASYRNHAAQTTIGALSGNGNLIVEGNHFVQMSYYCIDGVGSNGYSGNLYIRNQYPIATDFYLVTALELGSGLYDGWAALSAAMPDAHHRTALGIAGTVTLRGLDAAVDEGAYLYSGTLSTKQYDITKPSFASIVQQTEHRLTLDTAENHAFSGTVIGPLELVKRGSGEQSFLGDMSDFQGRALVQEGTLSFAKETTLTSAVLERKGSLVSQSALTLSGELRMAGGALTAASLTTSSAVFTRSSLVQATDIFASGVWTLELGLDNIATALTTLRSSDGSGLLTLPELNIRYTPGNVASSSYKVMSLSRDFAAQLGQVRFSRNGEALSLGSAGDSPLYLVSAADGHYDLMLDITDGQDTPPLQLDGDLRWQSASGTWTNGGGDWKQGQQSVCFQANARVSFYSPASVTILGKVAPSSLNVMNETGSVVFHGSTPSSGIFGDVYLYKSGAGTLRINSANSYTGGSIVKGGTVVVGNESAFGTGAVSLENATLELDVHQLNNDLVTAGRTSLVVDAGHIFALNRVVKNSGTLTLSGEFDVSALPLNSAPAYNVDVNGRVAASGFVCSASYAVALTDGGTTADAGARISHGSLRMTLGSDGVARSGGSIDYSCYLLKGTDTVVSSAIHAKGAGAVVSQTGGTLTADDTVTVTSTAGTINLKSGAALRGALSGVTLNAMGGSTEVTFNGSNTVKGTNYALKKAFVNNGTLTLSGSFDASALSLETFAATRVDVSGSLGSSGFARSAEYSVRLVNGGSTVNGGTTVKHGTRTLSLGTDGVARSGGEVDYSAYLLTGTATVNSSAVHAKSAAATVTQTGGTLTADDAVTVMTTKGTINLKSGGTLRGTVSGATVNATGGSISASFSGANTLMGSNYALAAPLSNSGTLTLSGSFDLTKLVMQTPSMSHVDVNGGAGDDGFIRSSGSSIQLVNGGRVINGGASFSRGGLRWTLQSDGRVTSTPGVDYTAYYLNTSSVSSSAVHLASGMGTTELVMHGGSLTADDTVTVHATGGALTLSGGSVFGSLNGVSVTAVSGALCAAFDGNNLLNGEHYVLQNVLVNRGVLSVSGSWDVSALTLQSSAATHLDVNGQSGESGFAKGAAYAVQVVNGGVTVDKGATLQHGSHTLVLGADGIARSGGVVDYGSYLLTGSSAASSSAIHAIGAGATVRMNGGTLTVNDAVAVQASAGTINLTRGGTLSGSIVGAEVSATGGIMGAAMQGGSLTVNGDVSLTGSADSTITLNGGTLHTADTLALATGQKLNFCGGALEGDLRTAGDCLISLDADASLDGQLLLDGGVVKLNGHTLNVTGKLSILSSTYLDVRDFGPGSHVLLTFGEAEGMWNTLYIDHDSRYQYTGYGMDGYIRLDVALPKASLMWNSAKGTWKTQYSFGSGTFRAGDDVSFRAPAAVTISGRVAPGAVVVNAAGNVSFISDKSTAGSGIGGTCALTKEGIGVLTLNAGNTYTGGTVMRSGVLRATAADSFGSGSIRVYGGTLDLGGKAVSNPIILSGTTLLKGDAKYTGNVTVQGNASLLGKTSYKGVTTISTDNTLTLAAKATMAGSILVDGGTLVISDPAGMVLARNTVLKLWSGAVRGGVIVGPGSRFIWGPGTLNYIPVLWGGMLDFGGNAEFTLSSSRARVYFGRVPVDNVGKGIVRTSENAAFSLYSGPLTIASLSGYDGSLRVDGGSLKLATGKLATKNTIEVKGVAAIVNGSTHSGSVIVDGQLAKGTNIKLISASQRVTLNGGGALCGTISGVGVIDVNASIDATAAKLTAARINLNAGTFTNTKGYKLAKGQTLTLGGGSLNLGAKGVLTTSAGSTLLVRSTTTLTGGLTLGGGELIFAGSSLVVHGTLKLSKTVTVLGSGSITFDMLSPQSPKLATLFGGARVVRAENTFYITGAIPYPIVDNTDSDAASPDASLVAPDVLAAEVPDESAMALPAALASAVNPAADAMVQADWGILDAERALMGAVNSRHQHAALLDKGRGAAWVSTFGSSVRHGSKGAHHGSDGNIEGAAFGLEHAVSETGNVGLAVGRSKNRLAATGVTHLRQETAHVALYGQKQMTHGFTADAAAAYGDTETKLGTAAWTQKSAALTARLTHARQLTDATAFRTFGGLSYEATDSASILGDAHSGSVQNLRAELGAGTTHTAGKAHLYAEAALTGDIIRHNPTADLDGTRTHGANPGRLGIRATLGGMYEFSDTWSGTASYGLEAESRSTAHTLNVGVSRTF